MRRALARRRSRSPSLRRRRGARAARRTSAAGFRCACRSPGPWVVVPPRRRGRSQYQLTCPKRLHRRRPRRRAHRPRRSTSRSSARSAARSTRGSRRRATPSSSAVRRARTARAPTLPAAHRLHARRPAAAAARRPRTHVVPAGQADASAASSNVARARRDDDAYVARCAQDERLVARDARDRLPRRQPPPAAARSRSRPCDAARPRRRVVADDPCDAATRRRAPSSRSTSSAQVAMSFGHPLLLLTLLVHPAAALVLYLLASSAGGCGTRCVTRTSTCSRRSSRPARRGAADVAAGALPARARRALRRARAAARAPTLVASDNATVDPRVDVSGSMQATDVKPTRLGAAQAAVRTFLDKVPPRAQGRPRSSFAGEAQVAAPPTTDHELVRQALDELGLLPRLRRHRDRRRARRRRAGRPPLGRRARQTRSTRCRRRHSRVRHAAKRPASTLVSILFLSDGHQTRGILQPLEGADRARAAGIPVYTVALGTPGNTTMRGYPQGFGGPAAAAAAASAGAASRPTRRRCTRSPTGPAASSSARSPRARSRTRTPTLGSKLGRKPGTTRGDRLVPRRRGACCSCSRRALGALVAAAALGGFGEISTALRHLTRHGSPDARSLRRTPPASASESMTAAPSSASPQWPGQDVRHELDSCALAVGCG